MRATMPVSGRIYAAILLLYPRTLRREFGQEMVEVFTEQLRDARRLDGWAGEMKLWGCIAGETVKTLATRTCRSWESRWRPSPSQHLRAPQIMQVQHAVKTACFVDDR